MLRVKVIYHALIGAEATCFCEVGVVCIDTKVVRGIIPPRSNEAGCLKGTPRYGRV